MYRPFPRPFAVVHVENELLAAAYRGYPLYYAGFNRSQLIMQLYRNDNAL